MRAAVVTAYGGPDVVAIASLPDPEPAAGQLLIRVRAASLNPLDAKLRAGALRRVMPLRFPAVLGFDLAGVVEQVGDGVTGWLPGDRVYGRTDARLGGTHAELAVVAASVVDRIPVGLSFEEAASLPLAAMTALQAIDLADLKPGERLLVHGAAGVVGSMAVQIGLTLGAVTAGASRSRGIAFVASLGAQALDLDAGDLARIAEPFDVVIDAALPAPTPLVQRALSRHGRYVTTGFSWRLLARMLGRPWSRQRIRLVRSRADGMLIRRVSALVSAGQLRPVVDAVFPLSRIADAYRMLARGGVEGKLVVAIP